MEKNNINIIYYNNYWYKNIKKYCFMKNVIFSYDNKTNIYKIFVGYYGLFVIIEIC